MSSPSKPNIYVKVVDLSLTEQLQADLIAQGFEFYYPAHTLFAARKKGINCTLYKSGKLVIQGKDKNEFIEFYLEPILLKEFTYTHGQLDIDKTVRIGIDESGKGDFFGPLCIAGVCAGGDGILRLQKMGVRDSKTMKDNVILSLASKIRAEFPFHIIKINPKKYNELYARFKNLNRLLAWGHATAIEKLVEKTSCRNVIIDQFASEEVVSTALLQKNLEVELSQRHRGEEDPVVAAASILAREAFLKGLQELSNHYSTILFKGANAKVIQAGKEIAAKFGKETLVEVGKLHFKTLDAIIS